MFLELETTGTVCPKNKRTEDIYSVQEDGTIVTIIVKPRPKTLAPKPQNQGA